MHVVPSERLQLATPQPGQQGDEVERLAIQRDGEEAGGFGIVQGSRLADLLSPHVHFAHDEERISDRAALSLHPVQEGIGGIEVFIEGFCRLALLATPRHEGISGHVANETPVAFNEQLAQTAAKVIHVLRGTTARRQIGKEIGEVIGERLLCGVTESLRRDDAAGFKFLLADELGEHLCGHLLVADAELADAVGAVAVELELDRPEGRDLQLAVTAAAAAE